MGFKLLELFIVKDNKFINHINKYTNKSTTNLFKNIDNFALTICYLNIKI